MVRRASGRKTAEDFSCEHHPHDFDRPLDDHAAADVLPHPVDRQLGRQPYAAVNLHAAVGDAEPELGAEYLADVALVARERAAVRLPGRLVYVRLGELMV